MKLLPQPIIPWFTHPYALNTLMPNRKMLMSIDVRGAYMHEEKAEEKKGSRSHGDDARSGDGSAVGYMDALRNGTSY